MTLSPGKSFLPSPRNKVAATLKKFLEIRQLSRYQRGLLYGGGAVLTLVLLSASALAIRTAIQEYIAEGRTVYLTNKTLLLIDIETKQAAMRRGIVNAETIWRTPFMPNSRLSAAFGRNHGRLIVQASNKVRPQLALGVISPQHPPASFAEMLSFSKAQAFTVTPGAQQRTPQFSGYFINADHTYLSIMPPPQIDNLLTTLGARDTADLIRKIVPDIGNLQDTKFVNYLHDSRRITWFPAARDPFTGEEAFKLVQPAFDGDRPFALFVSSLPSSTLFNRLRQTPYDGNFLIVDRQGKLILNAWHDKPADPGLTQKVLDAGTWKANLDTSDYTYHDGSFTISEPLSDTGWILAYTYSWRTIFDSHGLFLMAYAACTLLLLGLLWGFILYFDRKIFSSVLRRSERVFESEKLNRTIIATAPVGLSLLSLRDGAVLLQNAAMQSYDHAVSSLPQQLLQRYRAMQAESGTDDLTVTLADGTTSHLLVTLIKSKYQGEDVLLCCCSDISDRKQLEQTLLEARAAADAANHAKSAFLATMSHEIRTPLNGILGNLELLARTQLTALQQDRLQTINSSSHTLLDIINDILDFSKVEAGQMALETLRFDIVELVEQAIAIVLSLADAKDLPLFYAIPPTLPRHYDGDPTRIRQILVNLLGNAIKFTDRGKVSIEVSATSGTGLTMRVADTGIGISAARQRELFQPFMQADASITRLFGGTGLGLALCKRLTDLMRGTIAVDSREGFGSVFTVSLPLPLNSEAASQDMALPPSAVALLCPMPEWQAFIVPHLLAWGVKPTLIANPTAFPATDTPLVLFGGPRTWSMADEDHARRRASWVIDAREDGPRAPVIEQQRTIVSCYALDGLRLAMRGAAGIASQPAAAQAAPLAGPGDTPHHTVRVLVVEDHPVNLALIHDQLDLLGYAASLADKAADGLALFSRHPYDIVFTDLGMAGIDGYTFATILRSQGATLPIIAITAHASLDEYRRCKEAGIDDILLKPMSLDEIDTMVHKHLARRPAAPRATEQRKQSLSAELREVLHDTSQESLAAIRAAVAGNDADTVLAQLHSIKGAFAMQRQAQVVAACTALEQQGRAGDLAGIHAALPSLASLIQDALRKTGE